MNADWLRTTIELVMSAAAIQVQSSHGHAFGAAGMQLHFKDILFVRVWNFEGGLHMLELAQRAVFVMMVVVVVMESAIMVVVESGIVVMMVVVMVVMRVVEALLNIICILIVVSMFEGVHLVVVSILSLQIIFRIITRRDCKHAKCKQQQRNSARPSHLSLNLRLLLLSCNTCPASRLCAPFLSSAMLGLFFRCKCLRAKVTS